MESTKQNEKEVDVWLLFELLRGRGSHRPSPTWKLRGSEPDFLPGSAKCSLCIWSQTEGTQGLVDMFKGSTSKSMGSLLERLRLVLLASGSTDCKSVEVLRCGGDKERIQLDQ